MEEPLQPFPIQNPVYRRKQFHYREQFNRDSTSAIFHIVAAHCGCHIFLCGFLTVDELVLYPHDSGDTTSFNLSNASDRITFP